MPAASYSAGAEVVAQLLIGVIHDADPPTFGVKPGGS